MSNKILFIWMLEIHEKERSVDYCSHTLDGLVRNLERKGKLKVLIIKRRAT